MQGSFYPRSLLVYVGLELWHLPSISITRLPRYYEPLRHPKGPSQIVTDLSLGFPDPTHETSRVACAIPLPHMPLPIPRHGRRVHLSLSSPTMAAFPTSTGRSARASPFSRRAQHSLTLWPACSPRYLVPLCTRGFSQFVASLTAPVASGRSESDRVGFAPTGKAPP